MIIKIKGLYSLFARANPDTTEGKEWRYTSTRNRLTNKIRSIVKCNRESAHISSGTLIRWGRSRLDTGTLGDMRAMKRRFERELPEIYFEIKPFEHRVPAIFQKLINDQRR